jgi:hypothetical protein
MQEKRVAEIRRDVRCSRLRWESNAGQHLLLVSALMDGNVSASPAASRKKDILDGLAAEKVKKQTTKQRKRKTKSRTCGIGEGHGDTRGGEQQGGGE